MLVAAGVPPVVLPELVRSNRFLSLLERQRIATLRRDGLGIRAIAGLIGWAASTVSRELRRGPGYDGDVARARTLSVVGQVSG